MVYINKVYTKFGDAGQTMLASGDSVLKSSLRVNAYGDVDELNAVVGLLHLEIDPSSDSLVKIAASLIRIQQELFNLGAELATPSAAETLPKLRIEERHIEALEHDIDAHNEALEALRSFILPGGGRAATTAHLARTVCRRAERSLVALTQSEAVRPHTLRYLNRLSDLFFVLSRALAKAYKQPELLWDPKST